MLLCYGLWCGLLCGLFCVLFWGCSSPRPTRTLQISALGDSHTTGGRYLAEVHAKRGSTGRAIGLVGQGARVIAKRLPELLADRPGVVIVQAGVNDLASGRSLKHTRTWLARMHAQVRATGATVVAVPILPWAAYLDRARFRARKARLIEQTDALNAWLAAEQAAGRIDVLIDVSALNDGRGRLDPQFARRDGLHLNAAGQRALGRLIAAQLADE